MAKLIAGVALGIAAAAAGAYLLSHGAAPAGTLQPERIDLASPEVVLPLEFFGGRPLVAVTLDGHGPYPFILDTGAGGTVMKERLAKDLLLETLGPAQVGSPTGGKARPGTLVRIGRLGMPGATLVGLPVVATDLSRVLPKRDDPAGVLSAFSFPGHLITIDFPRRTVVIRRGALPAADGVGVLDYDPAGPLTIPMTVAGVSITAQLDTGAARGLTLPADLATRLPLTAPPVAGRAERTVDGESAVREASLEGELRIGRFTIDRPVVAFAGGPPAGKVGCVLLRRFVLTIDATHRRVRLEEPDEAGDPTRP